MYSIDYVSYNNDYRSGGIVFTHDYHMIIEYMALNVDTRILEENIIDDSNDESIVYDASMIQNEHYKTFIRRLNDAIIDSDIDIVLGKDMILDCDIDEDNLVINGVIRGSNKHISDEDMDIMASTHIVDFVGNNYVDYETANIYELKEMIERFVHIVAVMNGEGY